MLPAAGLTAGGEPIADVLAAPAHQGAEPDGCRHGPGVAQTVNVSRRAVEQLRDGPNVE